MPTTGAADLDRGLVSGSSRWDHAGDGISWNDTYVGFLWEASGAVQVFAVSEELYYNNNLQLISEISPGRTAVGSNLFRTIGLVLPFVWTPSHGFRFLPLPCREPTGPNQECAGSATGVSARGRIAVGTVQKSRYAPTQAARWTIHRSSADLELTIELLPTSERWSNAWDVSADGSVSVGDGGPSATQGHAIRWRRRKLSALGAVGESSSARFVSGDGAAALGWAESGGRRVLARWNRKGQPRLATPPPGWTIETIRAVNPTATAAAGALSSGDNWAPFVWTLQHGFTLIEELGRERDYDRSEALDISDRGDAVVGVLQASFINDGDPRSLGFFWSRADGLVTVNDLLSDFGIENPDFFSASAISGGGRLILAIGNPPRATTDTNSVLISLIPATAAETPRP